MALLGLFCLPSNIYLYLLGKHYGAIVSIIGFFNKAYCCVLCLQPYDDKSKHACESCCPVCTATSCKEDEWPDCHQICRNAQCLVRHKNVTYKWKSIRCKAFYKCRRCHKTMDNCKKNEHDWNDWFCSACEVFVTGNRLCYLRATRPKETTSKFVLYDVETTHESKIHCSKGNAPTVPEGCDACYPDNFVAHVIDVKLWRF